MRVLSSAALEKAVYELLKSACVTLPLGVRQALSNAQAQKENTERAKTVLNLICENAKLAEAEKLPVCQDTGSTVIFLEWGAQVSLENGTIQEACDKGVRRAVEEAYLRRSIVRDPLDRVNTNDNTPSLITIIPAEGEKVKVTVLPKGAGCENMTKLKMLRPADGKEGVKEFILEAVKSSGGNACPPLIVGVGLGGDGSKAPTLSKKALLREIGHRNPDHFYAAFEEELKAELNETGQGPLGLGGSPTVLDLFIETAPCHIASLPVAVSLNCHAARCKSKEL
ncbi:fumarate hydratase [bacterium]|nr:fumarate hydratase [bacterium]